VRRLAAVVALATGCSTSLGTVGLVRPSAEDVGLKLLRPGVTGTSCRSSVLGVPVQPGDPDLREALGAVLALDPEGDVVADARITWRRLVTGVYNRRCVEVRGDLARSITTIQIPMPAHEGHGTH
jgi:hypothetical protein